MKRRKYTAERQKPVNQQRGASAVWNLFLWVAYPSLIVSLCVHVCVCVCVCV